MKYFKILSPLLVVALAVLIRLFPHAPNFAPITAMALFGGVYLNKKHSVLIVFLTMAISDYLLLYVNPFSPNPLSLPKIYAPPALLHGTTIYVYGSFLLISLIGLWLKNHKTVRSVLVATAVSSILFFTITNFGVWLAGSMYPKTLDGLFQSYILALPFFRNTLLGDFFYTGLFFGGYEMVIAFLKVRNLKSQATNDK